MLGCKPKEHAFPKFFLVFHSKNVKIAYFDQRTECPVPKGWSKYTTHEAPGANFFYFRLLFDIVNQPQFRNTLLCSGLEIKWQKNIKKIIKRAIFRQKFFVKTLFKKFRRKWIVMPLLSEGSI